jgi:heat shock protein HslJ
LTGSYETNDTGHLIIKAATTRRMCIDKNAMTTENTFMKVINHTNYYMLDKGELKLFDVGNQQIATFKS